MSRREPGYGAACFRTWRRMLAIQRELFVAARIGSELVGAAMAGYDGQCGWVYVIVVYPGRRRQGIGRALMAEVERQLETS